MTERKKDRGRKPAAGGAAPEAEGEKEEAQPEAAPKAGDGEDKAAPPHPSERQDEAQAPETREERAPEPRPEEEDPRIAEFKAEVSRLKDQLLRAMAETENVRRLAERDREDAGKYAITAFARELLNVADNLRRALESVPEEARQDKAVASLVEGIELTERELLAVFERHGIRKIEAMGEKFDHNLHQAVFEVESTDKPSGTVVEVIQPGYLIADRLLRPAMVGVAKGPAEKPPQRVDTQA
ncbi:MAG: nucleotide exchange factor GrpE [Alphaproteobacteria bacterium]